MIAVSHEKSDSTTLYQIDFLSGDFDGDGDVDGFDFLKWQRGGSPNPLSASDLTDWEMNYGTDSLLTANSAAVPEPTSLLLMLVASLLVYKQSKGCVKHSATHQAHS